MEVIEEFFISYREMRNIVLSKKGSGDINSRLKIRLIVCGLQTSALRIKQALYIKILNIHIQ